MTHNAETYMRHIKEAIVEYRKEPYRFEDRMATVPVTEYADTPLKESGIYVELTDVLYEPDRSQWKVKFELVPTQDDFILYTEDELFSATRPQDRERAACAQVVQWYHETKADEMYPRRRGFRIEPLNLKAFVKAAYPSVRDFADGYRRPASSQE